MIASELKWIEIARSLIGTKEIRGPKTSPVIGTMLSKLHAWWTDDETPWCGTFVANCLHQAGLKYPTRWMSARAYAETGFGVKLDRPAYGCVVVFSREGGGMGVTFSISSGELIFTIINTTGGNVWWSGYVDSMYI